MPELPEVETVRRSLAPRVVGRRIEQVRVHDPAPIRPDFGRHADRASASPGSGDGVQEFVRGLTGRTITQLGRRGKVLIFDLDDGSRLLSHLKMTGRWSLVPEGDSAGPHTRLALVLDQGQELRFSDVRKFGRLAWLPRDREVPAGIARLGPEPLSRRVTAAWLGRALSGRKVRIKPLLLDQSFLAGLGNIYADESLFRAGIHPLRPAGSLAPEEVRRLHRAVRRTLRAALAHRGTTLRDYADADGRAGEYGEALLVYGRAGLPCPRCGGQIERSVIGGRSSHHCPNCQR